MTKQTTTTTLYSKHRVLNIPDINYQLSNSCTPLIIVNYLITLIATFLILHQSTNIKHGLFLCKHIIYPEWKRLWASFR